MFNDFLIYLFTPTPGRAFQYYNFIIILVVMMLVLGIGLRLYIKKNREDKPFRKLFKKYPSKLWTLAVLFALYLAVRYYYIPFFSMRFLMYLLLGATVYLGYQMINTYLNTYPAEKKLREKRGEENRYIIKKKKKKKKRR